MLSRLKVHFIEANPYIAGRVLLNPDFLDTPAHLTADVLHLLLDVNEESRVLSEVCQVRVKHISEQDAVRGLHLGESCACYGIVHEVCSLDRLSTVLRHHRRIPSTKFLHQHQPRLRGVYVLLARVLLQVQILVRLLLHHGHHRFAPRTRRLIDDLAAEFAAEHVKAIHLFDRVLGISVSVVLDDGVALIAASDWVPGKFDAVDVAEGREPLADFALADLVQHVDQPAHINLRVVVLLGLRVGVTRTAQGTRTRVTIWATISLLLVLGSSSRPVLLSLRCLNHDCLSHELRP